MLNKKNTTKLQDRVNTLKPVYEKMLTAIYDFADSSREKAGAYVHGPFIGMLLLLLLTLIFPLLFRPALIVIQLLLSGSVVVLYTIFNGVVEAEQRKEFLRTVKASFLLLISYACVGPFFYLSKRVRSGAIFSVGFIVGTLVILLFFVFSISETGKAFFRMIECELKLGRDNEQCSIRSGDIVLCSVKPENDGAAPDRYEVLPYKDRFLHMLILGATGTGKTSQILIPMIHQDIQNQEIGVIVLEPKGDLAQKIKMMSKHYKRPAKYFDPAMDDCPHFNPLAGREIDVVENIATTFRMLNPDSPTFFLDLNEQLVRNAVKVLKRLDKSEGIEGKNATLINLSRLLQNSGGQGRDIVQRFSRINSRTESEAAENRDIAAWFLNDYFPERSKIYENTSGIRSQVSKICSNEFLREVLNPDVMAGEHNDIDFDMALAEGEVICISTAQGVLRDLSRFLGYFIILQLQSAVFRRPGNENTRRACMLYIDEFQTYSTPGFADMLTMGRSYRVASHLATQARSQMAMGGGRDGRNFVNLVSTNARNVILFPGCSYDDAKYYSDQFGEYEKEEVMVGVSRKRFNLITGGLDRLGHPTESIRKQKKMTAKYSPTDLIYRPFGEITYCIIKNNTVQPPTVGIISYIPRALNEALDREIGEYVKAHERKTDDEKFEEAKEQAKPVIHWENGIAFEDGQELDDLGGDLIDGEAVGDEPLQEAIEDAIELAAHESVKKDEDTDIGLQANNQDVEDDLDFEPLDDSGSLFDGIVDDEDSLLS